MNIVQHFGAPNEKKSAMKTIAFKLFPASEQEDFVWSCSHLGGKRPDEFLVRAEEEDPGPGSGQSVRREVIVKHLPSGKARRYGAGDGSSWISKFQDDLEAVYFHPPLSHSS
jgi:hypothetical protein